MKIAEAIRAVMVEQGVKVGMMAGRLGKKQNVISERLSQNDMTITKAGEMLRVLDYKIVVIPKSTSTPKGGFEVE